MSIPGAAASLGILHSVEMTDHTRLLCLRHGESENVLTGTAGVLPAAPLTPRGWDQAVTAAEVLGPESITRIYSSTATRAHTTADIIAHILGVDTTQMPELLEVGIGSAEGATDQTTRALTAKVLRAWIVERNLFTQVADGETGHEVVARVCSALTTIASNHQGQTVAIVGHVASLTVALNELCNLGGAAWGAPLPHAVPFLVEQDGDYWRCVSWPTG
jgi:alpha-ribazole phosphatase/probable phosphoglycerate mutase